MNETRLVRAGFDCPKCGKPVTSREIGIMVAEEPEPVRWVTDTRWCSGGHPPGLRRPEGARRLS